MRTAFANFFSFVGRFCEAAKFFRNSPTHRVGLQRLSVAGNNCTTTPTEVSRPTYEENRNASRQIVGRVTSRGGSREFCTNLNFNGSLRGAA